MGRGLQRTGPAALVLALAAAGWSCGNGDEVADNTLGPIGTSVGATLSSSPSSASAPTETVAEEATAAQARRQAGFVTVYVWLAREGIEETISLDRASVAADELDPVSLDATCTGLDGGNEFTVSVIDMRRLASGARLVSATLRVDGKARRGTHEGTLVVGDAEQKTTTYSGSVTIRRGGRAGSFETVDDEGDPATGRFTCAEAAP